MSRIPCDKALGHERHPKENSGVWSCKLTTLRPLCIREHFKTLCDNQPKGTQPMLPGSSLRGMVRGVAELLAADCLNQPCTKEAACVVCRLFGFVAKDFSWQSKVQFSESELANANWTRLAIPFGGRIHHHEIAGRAVFGGAGPAALTGVNVSCSGDWCVAEGSIFRFKVEYRNLDPEEYAVLKFALTLTHGDIRLFHMLGYGKATGMGAVAIGIKDDKSPAITKIVDPYLRTRTFREFQNLRRLDA